MSTVIKIVGQITLKALTDVRSTTYYYLLQSSMAAAPSKPTTNPPTGGWSTTEPEFFIYMPTQDTTIISGKDYYIRSGEEGSYIYTKVLEPSIDDISNYYEKIYGDTRSLYVTVQTLYTDDTFDYSEPSLSSSYEAAKEAYNRAKTALDLAGDTNQYFWSLSSSYSTDVPAGVYVTHIPQSQFKSTPAQGNVLMQNTGLTIRNGAIALASLTGNALNFYSPTTHNSAVQLSGQALNFYSPSDDRLALSLDSSGLNFYGSSTVNPDASLTLNGLMLKKGGIKAGIDRDNGFVYLSSEDYQLKDATHNGLTINGHTPTAAGTDDKTIDDPAWREIIGTKFGVDSEGNLYANNANLSNATVEGAITATSLTIGSGSDSYNAINAMNAAGYTIEIINDITAAPDNVVISDNSTYLYPIMYHNGIKVESIDIINTQYIWYRGSDAIGIQGDSSNGGIVADYGYTYRVAYSFDDGEVGQAPSVQQVLVDPSKYITRISDIGITIHPEDTSENNYLQIDGNGITIYKNTDSVAQFGTTARIGRINNSRFLINSNSLQAYSGTDVTPYFEVNSTGLSWGNNIAATTVQVNNAAQTATNFIKTDENGIKLQNSSDATDYLFIDSSKIALYRNNVEKLQLTDSLFRLGDTTDYINLDSNGIQIFKNNNQIANFGTTIQIGANNQTHSVFNTNAIEFYNASQQKTMTIENGAVSYLENGAMKGIIGNISNKYGLRIGQHFSTDDACFEVVGSIYDSASGCTTTGIVNAQSAAKTGTSREFSDANLHLEAYSDNGRKYNYIIMSASTDGWNGIQSSVAISVNSDERLKKDFVKVNELSNIILNITPYIYSWKDGHTNKRHFGFKAQDVKHILEETTEYANDYYLVSIDMNNYYNLSYTELIPLMVDIIQKHEKRIAELESQLEGGID